MDFIIVKGTPGQVTFSAAMMGGLAMLRAWMVIYPSRRRGLTRSNALLAFEVVKVAALLLILTWVYVRNRNEDDQTVRSKREYAFIMAASLSVLFDTVIWMPHMWQ